MTLSMDYHQESMVVVAAASNFIANCVSLANKMANVAID